MACIQMTCVFVRVNTHVVNKSRLVLVILLLQEMEEEKAEKLLLTMESEYWSKIAPVWFTVISRLFQLVKLMNLMLLLPGKIIIIST